MAGDEEDGAVGRPAEAAALAEGEARGQEDATRSLLAPEHGQCVRRANEPPLPCKDGDATAADGASLSTAVHLLN